MCRTKTIFTASIKKEIKFLAEIILYQQNKKQNKYFEMFVKYYEQTTKEKCDKFSIHLQQKIFYLPRNLVDKNIKTNKQKKMKKKKLSN